MYLETQAVEIAEISAVYEYLSLLNLLVFFFWLIGVLVD